MSSNFVVTLALLSQGMNGTYIRSASYSSIGKRNYHAVYTNAKLSLLLLVSFFTRPMLCISYCKFMFRTANVLTTSFAVQCTLPTSAVVEEEAPLDL